MIEPMLATPAGAPLEDPQLVYEPKYDGIRAIAEVSPAGVRLWSRLGNEKTGQFPEVAHALEAWAKRLKQPERSLIVDGEIVALDWSGEPTGFQKLQGRIHLTSPSPSRPSSPSRPVAFIAFDLLRVGRRDLRDRPLLERRVELERLFKAAAKLPTIRISRQVRGNGRALYAEALEKKWEGLIAKHAASLYKSGKRTPDWRKIKIVNEEEFVVGGWTEPRQTRSYFGALLLGVYEERDDETTRRRTAGDGRRLTYVGHTGTGFDEKELARVMKLLRALETDVCPFHVRPKTNERPHWVRPELVAQIRFTEWTDDRKLRHPVYLGLRDDKRAVHVTASHLDSSPRAASRARRPDHDPSPIVDQLQELERARKNGTLTLPDGAVIAVTNLHKIFWPKLKLTKGDLFRYYARVAPYILPVLADRPLVMKRFPNGVDAPPFYQHRAADAPAGVRTADVKVAQQRVHIIGGDLKTLMYTTQLAAISQDPWFSRVQHPELADHVALDLDPPDDRSFARVLDVARWIRDELVALGAAGWPKTSGSRGLHVYIPLPPETPYGAGLLFCQIVGTIVVQKHARIATLERSVAARGKRIYVDFLQNILGKTLASAYSARATDYAGVSTPLSWKEVDDGVDPRDFTIRTVPSRLDEVGDVWEAFRKSKGIDLAGVTRRVTKSQRDPSRPQAR